MPYKFCKMIDFDSMMEHFTEIDENEVNSGQKYLLWMDEYFLPCTINFLAIGTRAVHMLYMEAINALIEAHPKILETNTMMKFFKDTQPLPIKKVYERIKDNCRAIQLLLADNSHDEAMAWYSNYYDTHPCVTTCNKFKDFLNSLLKEYSHDPEMVAVPDETHFTRDINALKVIINACIMQRAQVVLMMNSGVSNDELVKSIKEFFDKY